MYGEKLYCYRLVDPPYTVTDEGYKRETASTILYIAETIIAGIISGR